MSATPWTPPPGWRWGPGWGSPVAEPPTEPAPQMEGVTLKGLPYSERGGLRFDVAGLSVKGNSSQLFDRDALIGSFALGAKIPIFDRTLLEATLPMAAGTLGNPTIGLRQIARIEERFWVSFGGAFGAPLAVAGGFQAFGASRAFWDQQEFLVNTVPFALRFGLEGHVDILELRAEIDPVWGASTDGGAHYFALQHAAEVQLGHAVAGGVRYQGVAVATHPQKTLGTSDQYQGALEPFFRLYHDPLFLRIGLLLPLDTPLGTPFVQAWGIRTALGFSVD